MQIQRRATGDAKDDDVLAGVAATGTPLGPFTPPGAGGLVRAFDFLYTPAGKLLVVGTSGGNSNRGTVFKLTPGGTLSTLYDFTGGADGGSPQGDMLVAGGSLYSTASGGGDPSCQCGVIYQITAKGNEKVLHTFTGSDGAGYSSGVIKSNGVFYGTTASGGTHNDGVVFSVTKK